MCSLDLFYMQVRYVSYMQVRNKSDIRFDINNICRLDLNIVCRFGELEEVSARIDHALLHHILPQGDCRQVTSDSKTTHTPHPSSSAMLYL